MTLTFLPRREANSARPRIYRSPRVLLLGNGRLMVGGTETAFERCEYRDHPQLVEIRFPLPDVAVRVEGWNLPPPEG